jgi:uncharacterized protein (TIGR02118 family)
MIKFVSIFSLAEDSDHDKLWEYWVNTHAANARNIPGIMKYVINRVTSPIRGDNLFWGMAEIWFESMEAYNNYLVLRPEDNHWLSFYKPVFSTWVEEKEIE